jgi:16S rRNA (cytidine1402-2'-O)-methyltransferase
MLGNRRVTIGRELTKLHEELFHGTVEEAMLHFSEPRGEFTLVVAGTQRDTELMPKEEVVHAIKMMQGQGKSAREAISELTNTSGMSRKELYKLWLDAGN